jgi:hypothetical protein
MNGRDEARRLLRELLDGVATNGNGNGHAPAAPQVPAPPVPAVLRPSTWSRPPAPGEVIGDGPVTPAGPRSDSPAAAGWPEAPPSPAPAAAPPATPRSPAPTPAAPPSPAPTASRSPAPPPARAPGPDARVEVVSLDSDADLDRFVRALLAHFENPRDRLAIRAGKLRFALRRADAAPRDAMRIERGAVTERTVKQAKEAGARLVLAPRAVLTPLAREKAKALGVEIERERRC